MSPRKALTGAELSTQAVPWRRAKDLPWNTEGRRIALSLGAGLELGLLHLCVLRAAVLLLYVKDRALAPLGSSDQPSSSKGNLQMRPKRCVGFKFLVFKRRCSV